MLIEAIVGSLRAIVDRMTVVRITKLVLCFGLGFGLRAESACGQTANPPVADPLLEAALKRLAPIPVFTIINPAGLPVLDTVPNPKDKTKTIEVTTFFTGHQDAETLLTLLKTKNPAVGNVSRIAAISLRGPYEINMKQKDKAHVVGFRVVASQQQQEAGLAVLKQNGVQAKVFPGVPLFYATGGKDKGLLTVNQGNNQIIPFYFNKQDLLNIMDAARQRDPHAYGAITIEVTSLDQLFQKWLKEKRSDLAKIVLVPDHTAVQDVANMQKAARNTPRSAVASPPQHP